MDSQESEIQEDEFKIGEDEFTEESYTDNDNLPVFNDEEEEPAPEELVAHFDGPDEEEADFREPGRPLDRDDRQIVKNQAQIIEKVNDYSFGDDQVGVGLFYCFCMSTCGYWYWRNRKQINSAQFGHYKSSGRHMLTSAGIKVLTNNHESWLQSIPVDHTSDERKEHKWGRVLGSKMLVTIEENELGGAYRIGAKKKDDQDGEFILLDQGRYVLDKSEYRGLQVQSLLRELTPQQVAAGQSLPDIVTLGPVKILFVREGFLGGGYNTSNGQFQIWYPGAPYLLHEKEFEQLEVVERSLKPFKLGPLNFITVKEGEIGGAYHRETGKFQLLPPGTTYKLHSKDYEEPVSVTRTDLFSLGPYYFITVKENYVAGAYQKHGGKWVVLPSGETYKLSREEFEEPLQQEKNAHIIRCGPLTYLTVENGKLSGAYRVSNGQFMKFEDQTRKYVLHCKDVHTLTSIEKYTPDPQVFGPTRIITIPEGYMGMFEKEGALTVNKPQFYTLTADYVIRDSIQISSHTITSEITFKSKDGVRMEVNASLVWNVSQPEKTALLKYGQRGGLDILDKDLKSKLDLDLRMLAQRYNRAELLPTKEEEEALLADAAKWKAEAEAKRGSMAAGEEDGGEEKDEEDDLETPTAKLYTTIEEACLRNMMVFCRAAEFGIEVTAVKLEGVELKDAAIRNNLAAITQAILSKNQVRERGKEEIAKAEKDREEQIAIAEAATSNRVQEVRANSDVLVVEAESNAEVANKKVSAEADESVTKAKSENEVRVEIATSKANAAAEARQVKLDIEVDSTKKNATSRAESIQVMATANCERQKKEYEAMAKMSDMQFDLEMKKKGIQAMQELGAAAWRMPDKVMQFYESYSPLVQK